jgi:uncharacterized membrane protein
MKKIILIVLLILSNFVYGSVLVDQSADQEITITGTQVLPYNKYRSYLLVQNKGDVDVYLKFDTTHTATEGIKISAGGNYEPYKVPFNSIHMITASGTSSITVNGGH